MRQQKEAAIVATKQLQAARDQRAIDLALVSAKMAAVSSPRKTKRPPPPSLPPPSPPMPQPLLPTPAAPAAVVAPGTVELIAQRLAAVLSPPPAQPRPPSREARRPPSPPLLRNAQGRLVVIKAGRGGARDTSIGSHGAGRPEHYPERYSPLYRQEAASSEATNRGRRPEYYPERYSPLYGQEAVSSEGTDRGRRAEPLIFTPERSRLAPTRGVASEIRRDAMDSTIGHTSSHGDTVIQRLRAAAEGRGAHSNEVASPAGVISSRMVYD